MTAAWSRPGRAWRRFGAARRAALAAAALLSLAPAARAAEVFRCADADGQVRFTSDPNGCPGARRHELRGTLQTVPSRTPSATPPRAAPPAAMDAEAQVWMRKRREAEMALDALRDRARGYESLARWCNRGGGLSAKDEAGLKHDYSCDEARAEWERARTGVAKLEAYLDEGLEEECRRAGCLPGWIR